MKLIFDSVRLLRTSWVVSGVEWHWSRWLFNPLMLVMGITILVGTSMEENVPDATFVQREARVSIRVVDDALPDLPNLATPRVVFTHESPDVVATIGLTEDGRLDVSQEDRVRSIDPYPELDLAPEIVVSERVRLEIAGSWAVGDAVAWMRRHELETLGGEAWLNNREIFKIDGAPAEESPVATLEAELAQNPFWSKGLVIAANLILFIILATAMSPKEKGIYESLLITHAEPVHVLIGTMMRWTIVVLSAVLIAVLLPGAHLAAYDALEADQMIAALNIVAGIAIAIMLFAFAVGPIVYAIMKDGPRLKALAKAGSVMLVVSAIVVAFTNADQAAVQADGAGEGFLKQLGAWLPLVGAMRHGGGTPHFGLAYSFSVLATIPLIVLSVRWAAQQVDRRHMLAPD